MSAQQPGAGTIVAVGEILWDLLPAGPRLGGTTANFAIGCARLGRPATLISSLGDDAWGDRARAVLSGLQQEGAERLSTSLIQTAPGTPTGLVEVSVSANGQPQYSIKFPAAWDFIQVTSASLAEVERAQAICFGTLGQRNEASREAIRALIGAAPADCLRVLDVNVREPFFSAEVAGWCLSHANAVKISAEELNAVAVAIGLEGLAMDETAPHLDEIEACVRRLLTVFPDLQLAAVTLGPHGSLLVTPAETNHHQGFSIKVVDTVGAGDAFTAGLVHASLAGAALGTVNEVGNLCGSFVASRPGATPVFPDQLLAKVNAALAV